MYIHSFKVPINSLCLDLFNYSRFLDRQESQDVRDGKDLSIPASYSNFRLKENSIHQGKGPWIIILTDLIWGSHFPNLPIWEKVLSEVVGLFKTFYIYVIFFSEVVLLTCNFTCQIQFCCKLNIFICDLDKAQKACGTNEVQRHSNGHSQLPPFSLL